MDAETEPGLSAPPVFTWLKPYGAGNRYAIDNLGRCPGGDDLFFFDPEDERFADMVALSLDLNKTQMTELRDALTARLEGWGKP
jgi:hypothetical protein